MAKNKAVKKSEGRKPRLAPFVDSSFKIYLTLEGKEYAATVKANGMIEYGGKEYFSPSAAAMAINGDKKRMIDGWHFFKFNKNGERVPLDVLRGKESPLECTKDKDGKPKSKARKPKAVKESRATASESGKSGHST